MTRTAWLLLAFLAAIWGASYMLIKVALDDGVDAVFIVFARIALGALVLAPIALRRGAFGLLRGAWGAIALLAMVQVVVPFLLITFGEERIASSLAGILVASSPMFTALLAIRIDQDERVRGWGAAGIVVGLAGVVLLFGVDLSTETAALIGGLMVVLASLGYAIGALYLKHRLRGIQPVGVAASTMLLGALVLLPAVPFTLPSTVPDAVTLGSLVALGAGGTGVAFLIYYTLISDIGASRATLVTYIAPGFAILYGVTLLDEPLSAGGVLGLTLILAGSYLAAEGRLPWQPKALHAPPTPVPEAAAPVHRAA